MDTVAEKNIDDQIYTACKDGDLNGVKRFYAVKKSREKEPITQDNTPYHESSPLYIAALSGHDDIVDFLVEHGKNVNQRDKYDRTPLNNGQ